MLKEVPAKFIFRIEANPGTRSSPSFVIFSRDFTEDFNLLQCENQTLFDDKIPVFVPLKLKE